MVKVTETFINGLCGLINGVFDLSWKFGVERKYFWWKIGGIVDHICMPIRIYSCVVLLIIRGQQCLMFGELINTQFKFVSSHFESWLCRSSLVWIIVFYVSRSIVSWFVSSCFHVFLVVYRRRSMLVSSMTKKGRETRVEKSKTRTGAE